MTIKELSDLADICLEKRIKQLHFETNGTRIIVFDESAFDGPTPSVNEKPGIPDHSLDMPSDNDMLNWSSPIQVLEDPKTN